MKTPSRFIALLIAFLAILNPFAATASVMAYDTESSASSLGPQQFVLAAIPPQLDAAPSPTLIGGMFLSPATFNGPGNNAVAGNNGTSLGYVSSTIGVPNVYATFAVLNMTGSAIDDVMYSVDGGGFISYVLAHINVGTSPHYSATIGGPDGTPFNGQQIQGLMPGTFSTENLTLLGNTNHHVLWKINSHDVATGTPGVFNATSDFEIVAAVPEPSTWLAGFVAIGALGYHGIRRYRGRQQLVA